MRKFFLSLTASQHREPPRPRLFLTRLLEGQPNKDKGRPWNPQWRSKNKQQLPYVVVPPKISAWIRQPNIVLVCVSGCVFQFHETNNQKILVLIQDGGRPRGSPVEWIGIFAVKSQPSDRWIFGKHKAHDFTMRGGRLRFFFLRAYLHIISTTYIILIILSKKLEMEMISKWVVWEVFKNSLTILMCFLLPLFF